MRKILWAMLMTGLCACTSEPVTTTQTPQPSVLKPVVILPSGRSIDYFGLEKDLGLNRASEELGYTEKNFETCQAGYGYSPTHDCHLEYFVLIHFQLLCRDSEGTVSTALTAADLMPIASRPISWYLKEKSGVVTTDGAGFGQIRTVVAKSQRAQRLRLATGLDFLYLHAGEINRVVAPQNWCTRNE